MKELGEYLRETREKNHVGVEEAASDLNFNLNVIKNIENGNTRAFRDILELKEKIKEYAKYLGLDPEKIIDEFNDFLFEHTSKISLKDILEAEKKSNNIKKVTSPYTKIKQKNNMLNYFKIAGIIIAIIIIVFLLIRRITIPKSKIINRELKNYIEVRGD